MTALPQEPLTQAEFRAWELEQEAKHEYVDGYVEPFFGDWSSCARPSSTAVHSQIALRIAAIVLPHARPCATVGSTVLTETWRSSRYADLAVTCDPRDSGDATAIPHPKLIVEVLSESTAKTDLGAKMREYQTIATRDPRGGWSLRATVSAGPLMVRSVGASIDLDELYDACDVGITSQIDAGDRTPRTT